MKSSNDPDCLLQIHKSYAAEPDVLLSIHPKSGGYIVISNAESRTSGPNITESELFESLDKAEDNLLAEARFWDESIDRFS